MARQVLTLPDVPATLLTQAAGDARYSLVAHNHTGTYLPVSHEPGTDPHPQYPLKTAPDPYPQYYNQTRGDARYSQTAHLHTATYVDVTGDSMTGNLGIGVTPAAGWAAGIKALQLGQGGVVLGDAAALNLNFGANIYSDVANWKALAAGPANLFSLTAGSVVYWNAASAAANANLTLVERLRIHQAGTLMLASDTGAASLTTSGNVAVGVTPQAWGSTHKVIQVGASGALWADASPGGAFLTTNTYFDGTAWRAMGAGQYPQRLWLRGDGNLTLSNTGTANATGADITALWKDQFILSPSGTVAMHSDPANMVLQLNRPEPLDPPASTPMLALQRAGSNRWHIGVDHTDQFAVYAANYNTPLTMNQNGTMNLAPSGGNSAINFNGAGSVTPDYGAGKMSWSSGASGHEWWVGGVSWMQLNGTALYPMPTGSRDLGWPNGRWGTLFSVNAVNVSSQEMKNDLGLLDPEVALAEVLRVPVHRFTYKREAREATTPQDAEMAAAVKVYDEYERVGYMAEEATIPDGDALLLVGPDGVDPQNTASVLMAAVQALALRVAELQARLA